MASARLHPARHCTGAVTTAARTVTRRGSLRSVPLSAPPPPPPPRLSRSKQPPRHNPTNPVRRAEYSPWPVSPDTGTVAPLPAVPWAVCAPAWSFLPPLRPRTGCLLPFVRPPCPGRSWTPSAKQKSRTAVVADRDVVSRLTRRPAFPLPAELPAALPAASPVTLPSGHIRRKKCTN